jgi:uncharacterized pyridoxamine 5'-phosphate oxidase family protein
VKENRTSVSNYEHCSGFRSIGKPSKNDTARGGNAHHLDDADPSDQVILSLTATHDLWCNRAFLKNIRKTTYQVFGVDGTAMPNKKADIEGYGWVWFDEKATTNTLCVSSAVLDCGGEISFKSGVVHLLFPNGKVRVFTTCSDGQHVYDLCGLMRRCPSSAPRNNSIYPTNKDQERINKRHGERKLESGHWTSDRRLGNQIVSARPPVEGVPLPNCPVSCNVADFQPPNEGAPLLNPPESTDLSGSGPPSDGVPFLNTLVSGDPTDFSRPPGDGAPLSNLSMSGDPTDSRPPVEGAPISEIHVAGDLTSTTTLCARTSQLHGASAYEAASVPIVDPIEDAKTTMDHLVGDLTSPKTLNVRASRLYGASAYKAASVLPIVDPIEDAETTIETLNVSRVSQLYGASAYEAASVPIVDPIEDAETTIDHLVGDRTSPKTLNVRASRLYGASAYEAASVLPIVDPIEDAETTIETLNVRVSQLYGASAYEAASVPIVDPIEDAETTIESKNNNKELYRQLNSADKVSAQTLPRSTNMVSVQTSSRPNNNKELHRQLNLTHTVSVPTLSKPRIRWTQCLLQGTNKVYTINNPRGFQVKNAHMSGEFSPLLEETIGICTTTINSPCGFQFDNAHMSGEIIGICTTTAKHVPMIERSIHEMKECVRATWRILPVKCISLLLLIYMTFNCTFYISTFHPTGSVYNTLMIPCSIMTAGAQSDYKNRDVAPLQHVPPLPDMNESVSRVNNESKASIGNQSEVSNYIATTQQALADQVNVIKPEASNGHDIADKRLSYVNTQQVLISGVPLYNASNNTITNDVCPDGADITATLVVIEGVHDDAIQEPLSQQLSHSRPFLAQHMTQVYIKAKLMKWKECGEDARSRLVYKPCMCSLFMTIATVVYTPDSFARMRLDASNEPKETISGLVAFVAKRVPNVSSLYPTMYAVGEYGHYTNCETMKASLLCHQMPLELVLKAGFDLNESNVCVSMLLQKSRSDKTILMPIAGKLLLVSGTTVAFRKRPVGVFHNSLIKSLLLTMRAPPNIAAFGSSDQENPTKFLHYNCYLGITVECNCSLLRQAHWCTIPLRESERRSSLKLIEHSDVQHLFVAGRATNACELPKTRHEMLHAGESEGVCWRYVCLIVTYVSLLCLCGRSSQHVTSCTMYRMTRAIMPHDRMPDVLTRCTWIVHKATVMFYTVQTYMATAHPSINDCHYGLQSLDSCPYGRRSPQARLFTLHPD